MNYREVEQRDRAAGWRLRLFGEFRLISPGGAAVDLRNQKCEALLAVLAANPEGVEREFAASAIWPGKPKENRQESLRQAIAIIRRLAGQELIHSDRSRVRLSNMVSSDFGNPGMRAGGFMPGHDGEWFDQMRAELSETEQAPDSVVNQFLGTLRWCASSDPRALFSLFKASPSLVRGIPLAEILCLLNDAQVPEELRATAYYWHGVVQDDLEQSAISLRKALSRAIRGEEWGLASDACFEIGKVYCRTGQWDRALRVADAADEVSSRANTVPSRINAARLRGTLLVHAGRTKIGLAMLRESADLVQDPVRRGIIDATQAWFEAASGCHGQAWRSMEAAEGIWRDTGHSQVYVLNSMTSAVLGIYSSSRTRAIANLERISGELHAKGVTQFAAYADEFLAKLHELDGNEVAAAARARSARQKRARSKMTVTRLEQKMIALVF